MKNFGFPILLSLLLLVAIGCSGGSQPITPGTSNIDNSVDEFPILVSDVNDDGSIAGARSIIGVFSVRVDTETLDYEMIPIRTNASKDVLEILDLTNFWTVAPCRDCADMEQVGFTSWGDLSLVFGIRHPFDEPNFSEPISGQNRADLHIFNVEGMLVFDDPALNFPSMSEMVNPDRVTNADGYCGYLDAALDREILDTAATLHPYKNFFADYTEGNYDPASENGFLNIANPSGYMVMKQGSPTDLQSFYIDINPGETIDFLFVIMATYGVAADEREQRLDPVYHCPQFNKKAPSWLDVEILNNELESGDTASACDIRVKVLDMNHGVAVGTGLGDMRDVSDVEQINLEIPGLLIGTKAFTSLTPDGGNPRDPGNPIYYDLAFQNEFGADESTYNALVEVIDSYSPGLNVGHEYLGMNDGAERVPYPESPLSRLFTIDHFSTYTVFSVDVGTAFVNQPPVASFLTDPSSDCYLPMGSPDPLFDVMVEIDASASFDPDFGNPDAGPCGNITTYLFDFEWDGIIANFSPDILSPSAVVEWEFLQSGPNVIGVSVVDGCTPPLESAIASLDVVIGNINELRPEQRGIAGRMDYVSNPFQQVVNTTPMCVIGENVYVAWTANALGLDYVYAARSGDGGCTWGPYAKIYNWADCPLDTYVFVALDQLADGSPILAVVSPASPPCNYQAWFFVGENVGDHQVDWGRQYALDLFGANSAHIDLMGHPTDATSAYAVQWRLDAQAPNHLMFVKIMDIGIQPEPIFPHYEYDVGSNVYDLDLVLEPTGGGREPIMHVAYSTVNQVKYMSLEPDSPPIITDPVPVHGSGDVMPRNPRITLDEHMDPVVIYSAQNGGTDFNVIVKRATGDPYVFPNDPDYMTGSLDDDNKPDMRYNPVLRSWWLVYESDDQVLYDVLDSSFILGVSGIVNTDDLANSHSDLDPSIIYNPYDLSMNITWVEGTDSPTELSMAFNRTN